MALTKAHLSLIYPEPYISDGEPREITGILRAGQNEIDLSNKGGFAENETFILFLSGVLQSDYSFDRENAKVILPESLDEDVEYHIYIGLMLNHVSGEIYTGILNATGGGGISEEALEEVKGQLAVQLRSFKASIDDDIAEASGEGNTSVQFLVTTPSIDISKAAKGYTKTFTTSASSLASPEEEITKFVLTIPELEITERIYEATDNSAVIAITVPDTFSDSVLTISLYAIDAVNNRSKVASKIVNVIKGQVNPPTILYPSEGESLSYGKGITVQTTNFNPSADDTHKYSSWKITSDKAGKNILADEMMSTDLISHTFPSYSLDSLQGDTEYYIHSLHVGENLGESIWSSPRKIKTRNGVSTKNGRFIYRHESDRGIVIEWELDGEPKKLFVYDDILDGTEINKPFITTNFSTDSTAVTGGGQFTSNGNPTYYQHTVIGLQEDEISGMSSNVNLSGNGSDTSIESSYSVGDYYRGTKRGSRLLGNWWINTYGNSNPPQLINYVRKITNISGIDNLDIPTTRELLVVFTEINSDISMLTNNNIFQKIKEELITNSAQLITANTYRSGWHKSNTGGSINLTGVVGYKYSGSNSITSKQTYIGFTSTDYKAVLVRDLTYLSDKQNDSDTVILNTPSSGNDNVSQPTKILVSTPNIPVENAYLGKEVTFSTSAEAIEGSTNTVKRFVLNVLGEDTIFNATNGSANISFTVPDFYSGNTITIYLHAVDDKNNQSRIAQKDLVILKSVTAPSILTPQENETVTPNYIKVETDDFTSSISDTHLYTNWKLTTDIEGNNIVWSEMMSSDLIHHTFTNTDLKIAGIELNTDYYLFAAHVGANLKSGPWSYPRKIHTRSGGQVTNNGRWIYRHASDLGWIVEWELGGKLKRTFVYDNFVTGKNFCLTSYNVYQHYVVTGTTPFKTIYHNIETRGINANTRYDNGADSQLNDFNIPNSRTMCNWWLSQYYVFPIIEEARNINITGIGNLDVANSQEMQMLITEPLLIPDTTVTYGTCTPTNANNNQLDYYSRNTTYFTRAGVALNATTAQRFVLVRDLDTVQVAETSDSNNIQVLQSNPESIVINSETVVTTPSIDLTNTTVTVQSSFETSASSSKGNIARFVLNVLNTEYSFDAIENKADITFTIPYDYDKNQVTLHLYAIDEFNNQSKIAVKDINVIRGVVDTPSITNINNDDVVSYESGLNIQTTAFSSTTQDNHASSNYKITTDIEGNNIFLYETRSPDLTNHTFRLQYLLKNNFDSNTDYYVFASHTGQALGNSNWSSPVKIKPRAGTVTNNGHWIYRHESDKGYVVEYKVGGVVKRMFVYDTLLDGGYWCTGTFNVTTNYSNHSLWKTIYSHVNIRGINNSADCYENGADHQFNNFNNPTSREICNWWLNQSYEFPVLNAARAITVDGIGDLDIPTPQEMQVILCEPTLCSTNNVGYGVCTPTSDNNNAMNYFYWKSNTWYRATYAMNTNTALKWFLVRDLDTLD